MAARPRPAAPAGAASAASSASHGVAKAAKNASPAVLEHVAAARLDAVTQNGVVARQRGLHRLRSRLPHARAALDVRQQERQRAGGQRGSGGYRASGARTVRDPRRVFWGVRAARATGVLLHELAPRASFVALRPSARFELGINRRIATTIGIALPPTLLTLAVEVLDPRPPCARSRPRGDARAIFGWRRARRSPEGGPGVGSRRVPAGRCRLSLGGP